MYDHYTGGLRITINELRKYKIALAAIQETRWNKFTPQAYTSNGYNIYSSSLANNHGLGTAFLVDSKFNYMVINFTSINERLCVIRIKGRIFNYSTYMHQQMTQKRRPRINFMNRWSRHTQLAQNMTWSWWWETQTQKLARKPRISQR
jgi:hypothetical protein